MKSNKLCCGCGWVGDKDQLLDSAWNDGKGDGCPKCGETELSTEGGWCDWCGENTPNDDLKTTQEGALCHLCLKEYEQEQAIPNVHPIFAGILSAFMGVSRG